ncbi:MAG: sugar phosphate isomerase/epimerase [Candidatus Omnitrophica bacterium]|nr:sugar phosphate isomerase/epimerase [Candidatus Omnitrophota bacterium]MDD5236577.1 sugar phosphate isomerase/epimerase [Candidatus Omnitrophota bacterium]MDD5610357.1 sugar phosphate isomerase/epimerase [Candidatus Omnitrophota bacterium]
MSLALSTAWNYTHANHGKEIVEEIKKLGFGKIELNFSLNSRLVDEIARIAEKGEIEITSVHNFCPTPEGLTRERALPDCFSLASLDETQRERAVFYSKRSVDTAKRLKAKAVVLHSGRNEISDHTRELIALWQKGQKETPAFSALKIKMQEERKQVAVGHLAQILKSLEELALYAQEQKIALGIENRFYFREIPSLEEVGIILGKFKDFPVYYWHDSGHARIFENLGLVKENEYLDLYGHRLFGLHLHNVLGCVDHQSPNKGEIDFKSFLPYIKKEHLKVIESHSPLASGQDLKESKGYLERTFDGKL